MFFMHSGLSLNPGVTDNLCEFLAAINTALDDTNNILAKAQRKNYILEAQKCMLEVTLNGDNRPVI
jgi:hypothetical protein